MNINDLLAKLKKVKENAPNQYQALCPGHDDKTPSLSISQGDDEKILLHCFAGCSLDDVCNSLSITRADLSPNKPQSKSIHKKPDEFYVYKNEAGEPVGRIKKYYDKDGKKQAAAYHWESGKWITGWSKETRILYNLPAVKKYLKDNPKKFIVFCEGEKDCDNGGKAGLICTCNPFGAITKNNSNKWLPRYGEYLKGANVAVVGDNDKNGRDHAVIVAGYLRGYNCATKIINLPGLSEGGDLTDWINGGGTYDKFVDLVSKVEVITVGTEKTVKSITLSSVEARKTEFIWRPRIAKGNMTLLCGPGGVGKGLLSLYIASRISKGLPWPDTTENREPGDVLIISREDKLETTIKPRIAQMHADESRIHWFQGVYIRDEVNKTEKKKLTFVTNEDLDALRNLIGGFENFQLLILDPVPSYTGQADTHKNAEIRQALEPLIELAQELDFAILGIHHNNKRGSLDAILNVSGASAFVDLPRVVLKVDKDKTIIDPDITRCILSIGKNNLGKVKRALAYKITSWQVDPDVPILEFEREIFYLDSQDVLEQQWSAEHAPKRLKAEEFLYGFLKDGSRPCKEIMKQAQAEGIEKHLIDRASQKMRIIKEKVDYQGKSFWKLP